MGISPSRRRSRIGLLFLHAGVVIVADGTKEAESRIEPCIDHSFVWGVVRR